MTKSYDKRSYTHRTVIYLGSALDPTLCGPDQFLPIFGKPSSDSNEEVKIGVLTYELVNSLS